MSVKVTDLTKEYGNQKAVDNISFSISKGEIVGFLGPNGAGKSTTMKIISCYTLPSKGTVEFNNYNIYDNPLQIRKNIGYLPEHNPLYEDMYIKEYLSFTAKIHRIGSFDKRINELIEITGLGPELTKRIGALSKGYKQRVGLAQALLHDPEVLLMDEPTSGLDPNQIVDIRNLIREIGRQKTVILSSHIMQEVQMMCNRVIIINKGQIVADDSTENLLKLTDSGVQYYVEFNGKMPEDSVKAIDGVEEVNSVDKGYRIFGKDRDIAEKIFDLAVENQIKIVELKKETGNLEQIFQNLTISQNIEKE